MHQHGHVHMPLCVLVVPARSWRGRSGRSSADPHAWRESRRPAHHAPGSGEFNRGFQRSSKHLALILPYSRRFLGRTTEPHSFFPKPNCNGSLPNAIRASSLARIPVPLYALATSPGAAGSLNIAMQGVLHQKESNVVPSLLVTPA